MSTITTPGTKESSTLRTDARVIQWLYFLSAPILLWAGFWKTARIATTEAEALGLTLACLSLAIHLVILGFVAPLALKKIAA